VKRHLQGGDEILLWDAVFTLAMAVHFLTKTGDGDGYVVKTPLL
jgi:hypothetical protein